MYVPYHHASRRNDHTEGSGLFHLEHGPVSRSPARPRCSGPESGWPPCTSSERRSRHPRSTFFQPVQNENRQECFQLLPRQPEETQRKRYFWRVIKPDLAKTYDLVSPLGRRLHSLIKPVGRLCKVVLAFYLMWSFHISPSYLPSLPLENKLNTLLEKLQSLRFYSPTFKGSFTWSISENIISRKLQRTTFDVKLWFVFALETFHIFFQLLSTGIDAFGN